MNIRQNYCKRQKNYYKKIPLCPFLIKKYIQKAFNVFIVDFIRSVIFCVRSLGGLEVQLIPEVWLSKSHGRVVMQPPDSFTFLPDEALRATSQERPSRSLGPSGDKGKKGSEILQLLEAFT